jgi:hypothetical protein
LLLATLIHKSSCTFCYFSDISLLNFDIFLILFKKIRGCGTCVEQTPNYIDQTPKSIDQTPKSLDQTPKSIDQTPKSLDQTPKSIDQTPKSIDQTPKSDELARV